MVGTGPERTGARRPEGKESGDLSLDSAFFLLCFLPLSVALNYLLRGEKARNVLLLILSLLFCAFGSLSGLALLLAAALVNYVFGLLILRCPRASRPLAAAAVALDLAFLGAFKYLSFLLSLFLPLQSAVLPGLGAAAPLGISFFTFKCISYIVDTRRDKACGTRNFGRLLLYISFFPQLTAGPITRFPDLRAQLDGRWCSGEDLGKGLRRFVLGLGKKLLLAAAAGRMADPVFASGAPLDALLAWLGAVAYLMQIYFDFSGYSDMAIGLGRIFGFRTPENFDDPYTAVSITDFWRRWHISLSGWFRDYLYIPLGGNRRGSLRTALNKFLVFALCGLWHGAAWTFLLWGAWHGLLSALESLRVLDVRRWGKTLPGRILCHVYAVLAVCLGFVMFRAESVAGGWRVLRAMFGALPSGAASAAALRSALSPVDALLLVLAVLLCLPWRRLFPQAAAALGEGRLRPLGYGLCLLLLIVCLAQLAAGGFAPFIYARF
jgi:alginate O-acetyltransferase complex protein AlgI